MKIYTPLFIAVRIFIYSLFMFAIAEAIMFDASNPMEGGYFGEITLTEISQEIILFILFVFYLLFGYKNKTMQPLTNIVSFFFLASFFRELNFLIKWEYPVVAVFIVIIWLVMRDFKKIKIATIAFFSQPASGWFLAGFLMIYIFSRLMGRSKFWLLLYNEDNYRLAKAATEEGIELAGNLLMIIAAIEFLLFHIAEKRKS